MRAWWTVTLLAAACKKDGDDGTDTAPTGTVDTDTTRSPATGDTGDVVPIGPGGGTGGDEVCVVLYGGNDRVRGSDYGLPLGDTGRTLQAYIRTNSVAEQVALSYGRPSVGQGIQLGTESGFPTLRTGDGSIDVVSGDVFVADDRWHHLVATWDGQLASISVDGVLAGVGALNGETLEGDLVAGNTPTGDLTKPWIGWIDDVRIFLGPRDPDEIAGDPDGLALAQDLLLAWDFELDPSLSGPGHVVPDLSGHGLDGISAGLGETPKFLECR